MDGMIKKGARFLSSADPRCLCLFLAAGLECLLMAFGPYSLYVQNHFTLVPCALFLGIAWKQGLSPSAKKLLMLSAILAVWFSVVQSYHQSMGAPSRMAGPFFATYLLALPFAAVTDGDTSRQGLKIAGGFFLAAGICLALFTGLLSLGLLPGFLERYIYWDGARLSAMWHPNITANIFLMAMGFCFYFAVTSSRMRRKALFMAMAAGFFLLMCLTNSRTTVLSACVLTAGSAFFLVWKGGIKRFIPIAVAAVVILALLFSLYQILFPLHQEMLIQSYLQEQATTGSTNPDLVVDQQTGEASLITDAGQNSLLADLGTLNSRTHIWRACLRAIREDPMILVRGTPDIESLVANPHYSPGHAHNSWLEILMGIGLPGLLFALVFTGMALWHIFRIFFFGSHGLDRKIIALLALCLLISGILENYLFLGAEHYPCANFAFFLCLGYLTQWKKAE